VKKAKIFSLPSLAAASLFGWTIFCVVTMNDMRSAITSFMPFLGETGSLIFFSAMIVFYVASGLLIYLGVFGDKLPQVLFRLILGVIFMAAAVPKILDPAGFALDISHYDVFPRTLVHLIAIAVPWIEGIIAISLVLTVFDRGGVLMVNLFMFAFLVLLGQAWFRGLDIDCGCFGHMGAREAVSKAFVRDIFFVFWSLVLFAYFWKTDGREAREESRG